MELMKDKLKARNLVAKNIDRVKEMGRNGEIVLYRFGLLDRVSHTLQATGDKFGITRERVRQIEAMVLTKIDNLK